MNPILCRTCGAIVPPDARGGLCPRCLMSIDSDAPDHVVTSMDAHPLPPPPPIAEIARLFPELDVVRLIGRGGMGAVYEARQRELDRRVALKILWAQDIPDAAFPERFQREGRALARLAHENIVAVHGSGQRGPHCFLLMEYVDGSNLRDLVNARKLDPEHAMSIVVQMCSALQYAHEQGVVHRDIKPENVLINARGVVKIADFGLAKLVRGTRESDALTQTEHSMGTHDYMAPEQRASSKHVDHRADVYALGVVLYEALTGDLPLGRFLMPSRKIDVDRRIDEIVAKAMQAEPERRYQSASEVGAAVQDVVSGNVRIAPRTPPAPRRTPMSTLVGVAAVVIVALTAWYLASRGSKATLAADTSLSADESLAAARDLAEDPEAVAVACDYAEQALVKSPGSAAALALLGDLAPKAVAREMEAGRWHDAALRARRARALDGSGRFEELARTARQRSDEAFARWFTLTQPVLPAAVREPRLLVQGKVLLAPFAGRLTVGDAPSGGKPVDTQRTTFAAEVGGLVAGANDVWLVASIDANSNASLVVPVTVDAEAPTLNVSNLALDAANVVRAGFTVKGTVGDDGTPAERVVVTVGDVPARVTPDGKWAAELKRDAGPQELLVRASDAAGNPRELRYELVVDAAPPRFEEREGGYEFLEKTEPYTVTIGVVDDTGLQRVTIGGNEAQNDGDSFEFTVKPRGTKARPRTPFAVELTDRAGRTTNETIETYRDDRPPVVTFASVTKVPEGRNASIPIQVEDDSACSLVFQGDRRPISGGSIRLDLAYDPQSWKLNKTISYSLAVEDAFGNASPTQSGSILVAAACNTCKGDGQCRDCHGSMSKPRACSRKDCIDGTQYGPCPTCEGTGWDVCEKCQGRQVVPKRCSCKDGMIGCGEDVKMTCPDCKGRGTNCGRCVGENGASTGYVWVCKRNPPCTRGRIPCPEHCNKGLRDAPCGCATGPYPGRSGSKRCQACLKGKKKGMTPIGPCPECEAAARAQPAACETCRDNPGLCRTCKGDGLKRP